MASAAGQEADGLQLARLEQFLRGAFLVGDVTQREHDTDRAPGAVADGCAAGSEKPFRAVKSDQTIVFAQLDRSAALERLSHEIFAGLAGVCVQQPQNLRERLAQHLTGRPAGKLFCDTLPEPSLNRRELGPQVEHADFVGTVLECPAPAAGATSI